MLGIWLFVPIVLMKAAQAVGTIFNTRQTATGADGISLDGLTPAGVDEVLSLFAVLGIYALLLPLQSVVVLLRYRSMIPFMYLMLLILYAGNRTLHMMHPSFAAGEHAARPIGFYINLAILAVTLAGFVLSLMTRKPHNSAG